METYLLWRTICYKVFYIILTHFWPMFHLWINLIVGFYWQNAWKAPVKSDILSTDAGRRPVTCEKIFWKITFAFAKLSVRRTLWSKSMQILQVKFCKTNSLQNIDTLMNLENVSMQSWWKKFPFIFGFTCVVSITCHSAIFTLILAKIEIAKVKKPFKFQKTSKLKKANKQIKNKHKMLTRKSANFKLFSAVSLILGVISWYIFPNQSFCWDCFWEWGSTWFFRQYERGGWGLVLAGGFAEIL